MMYPKLLLVMVSFYWKEVRSDETSKAYEAFCTSEEDFQPATAVFHDCVGSDSQACEKAGGVLKEGTCEGMDTLTPTPCESMDGFEYKPTITCGQVSLYHNSFVNCTQPMSSAVILPHIQSTCCGGQENHLDYCAGKGGKKPYESICTSEEDFQADAAAFHQCVGSDSQACENAGGEFKEGQCEEIDTFTPTVCESIDGFEYKPSTTCELAAIYAHTYLDCNQPITAGVLLPHVQSKCCGGEENHVDYCAGKGAKKPHESICTSGEDFQADTVAIHACVGSDSQACENAGGEFKEGQCEEIDTFNSTVCESIDGFEYVPSTTCELAGIYLNAGFDCNDKTITNYIPHMQSTCCGGSENHLEVCGGATSPKSVCVSCAVGMHDLSKKGVSEDCFDAVAFWDSQEGNDLPEECDDSIKVAADVTVDCKKGVAEFFMCPKPITPEEICKACAEDMKTMSQDGVSNECFAAVTSYVSMQGNENMEVDGCDTGMINAPADVSATCKKAVMASFECNGEEDKDDEKDKEDEQDEDKEDEKDEDKEDEKDEDKEDEKDEDKEDEKDKEDDKDKEGDKDKEDEGEKPDEGDEGDATSTAQSNRATILGISMIAFLSFLL